MLLPRSPCSFSVVSLLFVFVSVAAHIARAEEPDTVRAPGVPEGRIETFVWKESRIYPGTEREVAVYIPVQYDGKEPAPVLVVQDGLGHARGWKLPEVLDNLIHRREIPAQIGVFISPGVVPASREGALARYNRSFEFDGMGDRYARLVLEEILPEVQRRFGLSLVQDGNGRAIAGASSGAIAAFNAAFERPDAFSRVLSTIGTYVGLRGGNNFPMLVRQFEPRPLRVFLEDGTEDLDNFVGSWSIANQDMLAALRFSGYEHEHDFGPGGHNSTRARGLMARALRFLWRGYPAPVVAGRDSRQEVVRLTTPGEGWRSVALPADVGDAVAVAPGKEGALFVVAGGGDSVWRVDETITRIGAKLGGVRALSALPDGRLALALPARRQVIALDARGVVRPLATGVTAAALAATQAGELYVVDVEKHAILLVDVRAGARARVRTVAALRPEATALLLTPDQSQLYVGYARGRYIDLFQRAADGGLMNGDLWGHLHVPFAGPTDVSVAALAVEREGRVFAATALGVQATDQLGRVRAVLDAPARAPVSALAFAGPGQAHLYAIVNGRLFVRPMRVSGVTSAFETVVPKPPSL